MTNFNTSHVNVNLCSTITLCKFCKISIHLMLMLISIRHINSRIKIYFNTSHVNVNPNPLGRLL